VSRYMPARSRIMEDFPSSSRRVRHQAITDQLTRIAGRLGQLAAQLGLSPAAERALRHDAALEVSHRKWLALAEDGGDREARARASRQHAGARRYERHVDSRIHRAGPNEARAVFRAGLDLATAPDWLQRPTCQTRPLPEHLQPQQPDEPRVVRVFRGQEGVRSHSPVQSARQAFFDFL
jgi:hypothetical protein